MEVSAKAANRPTDVAASVPRRLASPVPVSALLASIVLWLLAAIPGAVGLPSSLTFLLFVSFTYTSIKYILPTIYQFETNPIIKI